MTGSALITRQILTLGTLDANSGWYAKNYTPTTIEALIIPKSAQSTLYGTGLYIRTEALGLSVDPVQNGDILGDAFGNGYIVTNLQRMLYLDTFLYYFYDLQRVPTGFYNVGVASTSTDPRRRTKTWLDTYLNNAALLDDNGDQIDYLVQFAKPDYDMDRVFGADYKDIDLIYSIYVPQTTPIQDWNGAIFAYNEQVPIEISAVSKLVGGASPGITGTNLVWQGEQELRRISETYYLGSYRTLSKTRESTSQLGTFPLYSSEYILSYEREREAAYNSGITLTYGHGYLNDFTTSLYESTIYTASAGDTTHVTSAELNAAGNDYWNGRFLLCLTGTGGNVGQARMITDWDNATNIATTELWPNAVGNGDTFQVSKWQETQDGNTANISISEEDYLDVNVTVSAGNEIAYYSYPSEATNHDVNLGLSSTIYTKALWRYKCSNATVKAKVVLVFSDASTQVLMADTNSNTMTYASATVTTAKTIDHVRLYADSDVGHVYYDFILLYKNNFTFPNFRYGFDISFPIVNNISHIPQRHSSVLDGFGTEDWTVKCGCDITKGTWTRTSENDQINGAFLYDNAASASTEPWQWLSVPDMEHLKVRLSDLDFPRNASPGQLDWRVNFTLREYRESSGNNQHENYETRLGLVP